MLRSTVYENDTFDVRPVLGRGSKKSKILVYQFDTPIVSNAIIFWDMDLLISAKLETGNFKGRGRCKQFSV